MRKLFFSYIFLILFNISSNVSMADTEIITWKEYADSIVIDRYSLQKIFTKKITRWPNGGKIVVFTKPIHSIEHRHFVSSVLQMSVFTYEQLLEQQTFSGRAESVIEVANDQQMTMKVEATPGAIGYINYELYIGNKKVIVVDPTGISG